MQQVFDNDSRRSTKHAGEKTQQQNGIVDTQPLFAVAAQFSEKRDNVAGVFCHLLI